MNLCTQCESTPCTCRQATSHGSSWLIIPCQGCHHALMRVPVGGQREGMRCKWCEMGVTLAGRKG